MSSPNLLNSGSLTLAAAAALSIANTAPATASTPREIVIQATSELFGEKDLGAIDRYFGPGYVQHNPDVSDGVDGLRDFARSLAGLPGFKATPHRVIADGDLVVVQSTYSGFGPSPLIAFDIFRVADGRIVEHWDALSPITPPNPSGRTQIDGPTEIENREQTAANRALVQNFVQTVLVGAQYDQLPAFIDGDRYAQHNSGIADGLSGLGAAMEALGKQGIKMEYFKLHRVIAEGNFVLTQSEGAFGGKPTAYYDLFRVENGRIVEHWDVMQPIPAQSEAKNSNGMF